MNTPLNEIRERIVRLRKVSFHQINADDYMAALTVLLGLIADELERMDKALADKADEHPDEGIQFGGPIDFPKQP